MTTIPTDDSPLVGVIMGSSSDWERCMKLTAETLREFRVPFEARVVSAHRTPEWMMQYAAEAEARGLEVIIAGAGGAAHLPGMVAGHTLLPVIGVPVATMAIGRAGAVNAALLAVAILGNTRPELRQALAEYRLRRAAQVMAEVLELEE